MSKYTDDLRAALGIHNVFELRRTRECPTIEYSTQHPHALGHHDYRVEIFFKVGDGWKVKTIRSVRAEDGESKRDAYLRTAKAWAATRGLEVEEWAPTGFANSWMPKGAKDQMSAELKAWRKEQRAKQDSA